MDSGERRFKALDFLLDYSRGTLWWVNNRLWNETIKNFVWKRQAKAHPGLSLARGKVAGIYDTVPMLIGTSRNHAGKLALAVRHISAVGAEHYNQPTYFAPLRPCSLRFDEFGRIQGIRRNEDKPRLDAGEMRRLDEILQAKEI